MKRLLIMFAICSFSLMGLLTGCAARHVVVTAPPATLVCGAGWSQAEGTCWRYLPSDATDSAKGIKCSRSMRGMEYSTAWLCEQPARLQVPWEPVESARLRALAAWDAWELEPCVAPAIMEDIRAHRLGKCYYQAEAWHKAYAEDLRLKGGVER